MATESMDAMQLSVCHGDIKFYFVTKSGTAADASKDLLYSFEVIADFSSSTEHLQWISNDNCLLLSTTTLTKQNIFIMDYFEGPAFDYLSSTKAIILGPRCVLSCQLTNDNVPNIASPIFTLAMKNVVACVSGINVDMRAQIHKLIGFMGGLWTKDLTESNTHLITNTIKSVKYEKAALSNMNIMNEKWVFDVWNISRTEDTSYTTDDFLSKYKLPIFYKLVITSTGIPDKEKCEIKKLIDENGGTYNGSFKSATTDILISQPNQKNSEKFKAAVKCRKECLMVDWIRDSVTKGYALPFINYRIYTGQPTASKVVNSTQISNRSLRTNEFTANATQLSVILGEYSIAESTLAKNTPMPSSLPTIDHNKYKKTLDNIDMNQLKNAVGCLEGCIIWLCGFEASETEKLKKIINIGGAIRFDEHNSKVDYVIVGKPNSSDLNILKSLKSSNIVTVEWLVRSINKKTIADHKEFIYHLVLPTSEDNQTAPSPASRKNIESMRPDRKPGLVPRRLKMDNENEDIENEDIENEKEKTLLAKYSQAAPTNVKPHPVAVSTTTDSRVESESESIDVNLFQRRTFAIFGFSEESSLELKTEIEEFGGINVNDDDFSKVVDYLVITTDTHSLNEVKHKSVQIVTDFWIQECTSTNKLVDIAYYHRPILLNENVKPLEGLHIVFSTYTASERDYLICLANALGGDVNDRFIRKESPILVCPTPEGQKYAGAVKWNLPVVTCEWLLECHELEKRISLNKYLVGEAKCQDDDTQNSAKGQNVRNISTDKNDMGNKSDHSDNSEKSVKSSRSNKRDRSDVYDHPEITKSDLSDVSIDRNITPVKHRRVSAIIHSVNRQVTPLSQSPKSPVDLIAKYVEDIPTPNTRRIAYDVLKHYEDNETPRTKQLRLENVTDSPIDLEAIMQPPDLFEMIDKKYTTIPKTRQSTPFYEYRKRMYIKGMGDLYDGSPLRYPYKDNVEEKKDDEAITSVSTQVQNLENFVKKNREDRKSIAEQHTALENKNNDDEEHLEANIPFSQVDSEKIEEQCVGWRDPDEFFQSERFLQGSRSLFKGTMCFSISLATDIEQDILKERIVALNGTLSENMLAFDPSCTHLICSKPNQSEKTLAVIAAGRWLLCVDYIEDSFNAGHFLNEENYEWGNPKAEAKLPTDIDAKSKKLATVSHKWRKKLQLQSQQGNEPVGIFSNFRVILHARKDSFKRLLEAGCGVVIDIKPPYSEQKDFRNVTHCIFDKRMPKMSENDRLALEKAGVHCVNIMYLQECILSDNWPSAKDFPIN